MPTTTKKVTSETPENESNNNLLVERESVLNDIKSALEKRFDSLRDQAMNTSNLWEHYDIDIMLKELKYVYEHIIK